MNSNLPKFLNHKNKNDSNYDLDLFLVSFTSVPLITKRSILLPSNMHTSSNCMLHHPTLGMEFVDSLEAWKTTEQLALEWLRKKYPATTALEWYCKAWDIYCPENKCLIEIKQDFKSKHTGNFVIEYEMWGKPSALATTLADVWWFYDGDDWFWISPRKIKDMIVYENPKQHEFVWPWDYKSKKTYLVRKETLKKYSKSSFEDFIKSKNTVHYANLAYCTE